MLRMLGEYQVAEFNASPCGEGYYPPDQIFQLFQT
jgi:hypothetical protein